MAPPAIPAVREALAARTRDQCRALASTARSAPDPTGARSAVTVLAG